MSTESVFTCGGPGLKSGLKSGLNSGERASDEIGSDLCQYDVRRVLVLTGWVRSATTRATSTTWSRRR
jgi:hydroxyacid-oxoacid transhydrogenase